MSTTASPDLVTCDDCDATSEAGWGDQPTCLDCTPPHLVCDLHRLTVTAPGDCHACRIDREAVVARMSPMQRHAAEIVAAEPDCDVDSLIRRVGVKGYDDNQGTFLLRLLRTGVVRLKIDANHTEDFDL